MAGQRWLDHAGVAGVQGLVRNVRPAGSNSFSPGHGPGWVRRRGVWWPAASLCRGQTESQLTTSAAGQQSGQTRQLLRLATAGGPGGVMRCPSATPSVPLRGRCQPTSPHRIVGQHVPEQPRFCQQMFVLKLLVCRPYVLLLFFVCRFFCSLLFVFLFQSTTTVQGRRQILGTQPRPRSPQETQKTLQQTSCRKENRNNKTAENTEPKTQCGQ